MALTCCGNTGYYVSFKDSHHHLAAARHPTRSKFVSLSVLFGPPGRRSLSMYTRSTPIGGSAKTIYWNLESQAFQFSYRSMNIIPTHSTTSITSVIDRFPGLRSVIVESERLAQPATILEGARMLCDPWMTRRAELMRFRLDD
ncbi:hypothetical protein MPER_12600 [Moniliophthora perniciosa FA553]|nr:hypothetical protein MPER_12600 [Moniliophthora perniciosa FA553]